MMATATRFPTLLASVHQGPPPFMACADARRVAAGERSRTGVNETKIETVPGQPTGRARLRPEGGR